MSARGHTPSTSSPCPRITSTGQPRPLPLSFFVFPLISIIPAVADVTHVWGVSALSRRYLRTTASTAPTFGATRSLARTRSSVPDLSASTYPGSCPGTKCGGSLKLSCLSPSTGGAFFRSTACRRCGLHCLRHVTHMMTFVSLRLGGVAGVGGVAAREQRHVQESQVAQQHQFWTAPASAATAGTAPFCARADRIADMFERA